MKKQAVTDFCGELNSHAHDLVLDLAVEIYIGGDKNKTLRKVQFFVLKSSVIFFSYQEVSLQQIHH
jgi:hypothetical protein